MERRSRSPSPWPEPATSHRPASDNSVGTMGNGLQSSADPTPRRPTAPGRGSSSRRSGIGAGGGAGIVWTLLTLVLVAGAYYAIQANSGNGSVLGWSLAGGVSSGPVKISGYAGSLYPGANSQLQVKVENG